MRDYLPHNWKKAEAHNRNLDGLRRALPPQAEPDRDAPSPPPDLVLEREERVAVAPGKPGARSKQERVFDLLDAIEHAGGPIREEG